MNNKIKEAQRREREKKKKKDCDSACLYSRSKQTRNDIVITCHMHTDLERFLNEEEEERKETAFSIMPMKHARVFIFP